MDLLTASLPPSAAPPPVPPAGLGMDTTPAAPPSLFAGLVAAAMGLTPPAGEVPPEGTAEAAAGEVSDGEAVAEAGGGSLLSLMQPPPPLPVVPQAAPPPLAAVPPPSEAVPVPVAPVPVAFTQATADPA